MSAGVLAAPTRQPTGPRPSGVWARVLGAAVVAALLAGCRDEVRLGPDVRAQLTGGARTVDSLAALADTAPGRLDAAGLVALGYLERQRLGLGSPFRLVDAAGEDTRLPVRLGQAVGWALLGRAVRGDGYAVDPAALADQRPGVEAPLVPPLADGARHRAVIDSVVEAAPDARTGEGVVRLGYTLARAERLVSERVAMAAVHAAALARDRRLAATDAERLLQAITAHPDSNAFAMLRGWREARRLTVELPLLADAMRPRDAEVVRGAERLLGVLRAEAALVEAAPAEVPPLEVVPVDTASVEVAVARAEPLPDSATGGAAAGARAPETPAPISESGLREAVARRLAVLPGVRDGYPSAPIVVTLGGFHKATITAATRESAVRARLVTRARTEETLAAEWAIARAALPADAPARRELAAMVQAAAVAVRTLNQSSVVPPTAPGGTSELLARRDGMRPLAWSPDVPAPWRAYAARDLASALADLRLVLPGAAVQGLGARIGESPRGDRALALHDPTARTMWLPPLTAAGTVAHELAHDLDWQTARTRLAIRGIYGTDRIARNGGQGSLAVAVRTLAEAPPRGRYAAASPGRTARDLDRPAERFARATDFYVAAAMARDGRMNGVLTAVQDEVLAGYAAVVPPDPGDGSAEATVELLHAMTPLPATTRDWFLRRFGRTAPPGPLAAVRPALEAPVDFRQERLLSLVGVPPALEEPPETDGRRSGCTMAPVWRERLLWVAADARARGLVRMRGTRAAAYAWAPWGWGARASLGGPWDPALAVPALDRVRDAVLRAAHHAQDVRAALAPTCR